jgi:hypothetical protein
MIVMRQFRFPTRFLLGTFCAAATLIGPHSVPLALGQTVEASRSGTIGGDFQPLESFSVRVDEVKVGQGNTLEVLVTVKNGREQVANFTAGSLDLYITDADGIGFRDSGNLYHVSGATPRVMSEHVGVEGKGQAQVRYIFNLPKGFVPLRTLTFQESGSDPYSVDISSVKVPGATEPGITVSSLVGGSGGFAELGPYDVRLDGLKRGRNNTLHAYFTFKNVSGRRQQFTVSDFNPRLISGGTSTRDVGNLYRASGGPEPDRIGHTVLVANESSATVRYLFRLAKDASPSRLVISTYGDVEQSYVLPKIP